jgi:hypothetical protein
MVRLYCNEITVKFTKTERNTQRIRFSMGGTTAQTLVLEDDDIRLVIKFMDKAGFAVKLLCWPMSEIHEYDCTEIQRPQVVESGGKNPNATPTVKVGSGG